MPRTPRRYRRYHSQIASTASPVRGQVLLFILQVINFLLAVGLMMCVRVAAHAPLWAAVLSGVAYFFVAWQGYLLFQSANPHWLAPWDEGLMQWQRMLDAFIPSLIAFLLFCLLMPVFERAREKARQTEQRRMQQRASRPLLTDAFRSKK